MFSKVKFAGLLLVAIIASLVSHSSAGSSEERAGGGGAGGHQGHHSSYQQPRAYRPAPQAHRPAPRAYAPAPRDHHAPAYGKQQSQERYDEDTPYQFAYKVVAGGAGGARGYGGGSDEQGGYGRERSGYDSETAEFGHAESGDYGKTEGKYFVQQPDGRVRTVEYTVEGDSGFLAKVSYSGDEDHHQQASRERY